ncbi:hypothetical protein BIW11_04679, partial [Tropilaelaps mercedesae]
MPELLLSSRQQKITRPNNVTNTAHKSRPHSSASNNSSLSDRESAPLTSSNIKKTTSASVQDRKGMKLDIADKTPVAVNTSAIIKPFPGCLAHNPPLAQARKSDPKVVAKKSSPMPSMKSRTEHRRKSSGSAESNNCITLSYGKEPHHSIRSTTATSKQPQNQQQTHSDQQQCTNDDARRNGVNALARIVRERCEKESGDRHRLAVGFGDDVSEAAIHLAQKIERALWAYCGGVAKNY